MTSMNLEAEVLKQDKRGRIRVPAERREALLDEFERSGMTAAGFARLTGIKYATFAHWTLKRRKRQGATGGGGTMTSRTSVGFLEAVVEGSPLGKPETGSHGLLVEMPGGSRMRVESPVQLAMAAELVGLIARHHSGRC